MRNGDFTRSVSNVGFKSGRGFLHSRKYYEDLVSVGGIGVPIMQPIPM